ncbi:MAG TPA: GMC family oxidoreductase [bacterium]|nr:GMC family oxidoreductase [bacterium]
MPPADRPSLTIVGSGIAGALIAYLLTAQGRRVEIFERGPAYPYPHTPQFEDRFLHRYDNPAYRLPSDLQGLTASGTYGGDVDRERHMVVGGTATHWAGIALRMIPEDFRTKTLYGFGDDWPIGYDDLEPYYSRAEALLGVSGTDADNPFAPKRSRPYPLPPFELSYEDRKLAARLAAAGIVLHTTPQAATRLAYGDRPGCQNFGACDVCPIGVRYSPNYHLARAVATGRCTVHRETSVRRIATADGGRRAASLIYRANGGDGDREHRGPVIVLAGGAIENARLLLLSSRDRYPDGVPLSGVVGRRLTFHHLWSGSLRYADRMMPGRLGRWTGQSHQFLTPPSRGRHGAVKVEFSANVVPWSADAAAGAGSGDEILDRFAPVTALRDVTLHSEAAPETRRTVTLSSSARDRFGDPYAHVHYDLSGFDEATYAYARELFDRFAKATGAAGAQLRGIETYYSGGHHMGTCRMGLDRRDSAVDSFGALHGCPNLFVAGSSMFVGPAAVNPTLTIAALAIRTADRLARMF